MCDLVFLVLGIVLLFVPRLSVTGTRELRSPGKFIVAACFILPFPLAFLAGLLWGVMHAGSTATQAQMQTDLMPILIAVVWIPIIAGIVLAFVLAKPKELGNGNRGFDVMPPPPPPPGN